ncbi:MAG: flippase [Nitrospirae bacterium]|nr:flippase [Nitrospirota bacterium]
MAARAIDVASNFLLLALVARYLGVAEFGVYSFLIAVIWTVFPFLLMGGPRILARDISQDKKNASALIGSAITLIGLLGIPAIVITAVYVLLFNLSPDSAILAFVILLSMLAMGATRTLNSVFVAFERMHFETIMSVFISLSSLLFTAAAIYLDLGLRYIFIGMLLSNISSLGISIFFSMRHFSVVPMLGIKKDIILYLLRESAPIAVSQFLLQIYLYSGVFVLKLLSSNFDLGLFQAPYRLITRLQVIPMTFVLAMLPVISQLAANESAREILRTKALFVSKILIIVSLPIMIFGFIFSEKIIYLLFGAAFSKSIIALQIQILGLGLFFLNTFFEILFISLKKQRYQVVLTALGLFVSLVLNFIMVPDYGYIAASAAVPISQAVIFLAGLYYLSDIFNVFSFVKVLYKPALAACVIVLFLIAFSWINYAIATGAVLLIYPVMLFAFKAFSQEEIGFLKRAAGIKTGLGDNSITIR